jgi:hypothetical protein
VCGSAVMFRDLLSCILAADDYKHLKATGHNKHLVKNKNALYSDVFSAFSAACETQKSHNSTIRNPTRAKRQTSRFSQLSTLNSQLLTSINSRFLKVLRMVANGTAKLSWQTTPRKRSVL